MPESMSDPEKSSFLVTLLKIVCSFRRGTSFFSEMEVLIFCKMNFDHSKIMDWIIKPGNKMVLAISWKQICKNLVSGWSKDTCKLNL